MGRGKQAKDQGERVEIKKRNKYDKEWGWERRRNYLLEVKEKRETEKIRDQGEIRKKEGKGGKYAKGREEVKKQAMKEEMRRVEWR